MYRVSNTLTISYMTIHDHVRGRDEPRLAARSPSAERPRMPVGSKALAFHPGDATGARPLIHGFGRGLGAAGHSERHADSI